MSTTVRLVCLLCLGCLLTGPLQAQDIEPRRWSHMPTGLNVVGLATSFSEGEIFLDPILQAEDVTSEVASGAFVYLRTFSLFGRSARVDVLLPYASGRWEGLVDGVYTTTRRRGFANPRLRLSVLLYGGEALNREEFAATERSSTVIGAALGIKAPWGDYQEDKLINLSSNRWTLRPQLGVTHVRGKWTYELTGSVFIYSDNDDFWNGNKLENDPLWAIQGHLIYTFRPGLWTSLSTGWGTGADAHINGEDKEVIKTNWVSALSFGFPIDRTQGIKLVWLRSRSQESTGSDSDSLIVGWSKAF